MHDDDDTAADPYPGLSHELRQYVYGIINACLADQWARFDKHYEKLNTARWVTVGQEVKASLAKMEQQIRNDLRLELGRLIVEASHQIVAIIQDDMETMRQQIADIRQLLGDRDDDDQQPQPPTADQGEAEQDASAQPASVPADPVTIPLPLSPAAPAESA